MTTANKASQTTAATDPAATNPAATDPAANTQPAQVTFTKEQIQEANRLDKTIRDTEKLVGIGSIQQARALSALRRSMAYTQLHGNDDKPFTSWTQYVKNRTSKSEAQVATGIGVVEMFTGESDERLGKAGVEKLSIVRQLVLNKSIRQDEAVDLAIDSTRVELIEMQRSNGKTHDLVPLTAVRVPKAIRSVFNQVLERFKAFWISAHPGESYSDIQVMDYMLTTAGGHSDEFMSQTAQGMGGADPDVFGGMNLSEVSPTAIIIKLADRCIERGIKLEDFRADIDSAFSMKAQIEEDAKKQRELAERDRKKDETKAEREKKAAEKKAEKELANLTGKLGNVKMSDQLVFLEGELITEVIESFEKESGKIGLTVIKGAGHLTEKGIEVSGKGQAVVPIATLKEFGAYEHRKFKAPSSKKPKTETATEPASPLSKKAQASRGKGAKSAAPAAKAKKK